MSLDAGPCALAPWALQPLKLKGAIRTALSLCGWASLREAGEEGDPWLGLDPTILVLGEPKGFLCVTSGTGASEVCDPSLPWAPPQPLCGARTQRGLSHLHRLWGGQPTVVGSALGSAAGTGPFGEQSFTPLPNNRNQTCDLVSLSGSRCHTGPRVGTAPPPCSHGCPALARHLA